MLRLLAIAMLVASASGCEYVGISTPAESSLVGLRQAQEDQARTPIGRYAFAGKKQWSNGIEFYYLDTRLGRICTAFFTEKPEEIKDSTTCSDSVTSAPLGDL